MTLWPDLTIAALALLFAGFSRGFSGFGAALIAMPVLAILYGPVEGGVIMTLLEVPAMAMLLPSVARNADWRAIMSLGLAPLVTIPLGTWFVVWLCTESLQRVIGVLVLIFAFLLATGWRYKRAPTLPVLLGVGDLSGVVGGAANMSGPLVVVFLLAGPNSAREVRSGVMAYFSFATLLRVAVYTAYGFYSMSLLLLSLTVLLPSLAGIWAGSHLFQGVSDRFIRYAVLVLVAAMGIVALVW